MKHLILFYLYIISNAFAAFTKEDIVEMQKAPHKDVELVASLKVFTYSKVFDVKAETLYNVSKDPARSKDVFMKSHMKIIDKNTIFTSYKFPWMDEPFCTVITHDVETGLYIKHILTPDKKIRVLRGVSIKESRSMHWSLITPKETTMNIETYFDDKYIVTEAFLDKDEKIYAIIKFTATAIKKAKSQ